MLKTLFASIGGFPALGQPDWTSALFNYERALIELHRRIKKNFLFEIEIRQDEQAEKFVYVSREI